MDKENPYHNSILQAALRPEFQHRSFQPEDYELVEGYPLRKDRFLTLCSNLAQTLYGRKWSMVALGRHVKALLYWWNRLRQVDTFVLAVGKPQRYDLHEHEWLVTPGNWLEAYLLSDGVASSEPDQVLKLDVVLTDGSYLRNVTCVPARLPQLQKSQIKQAAVREPLSWVSESTLIWQCHGMDLPIPLSSVAQFASVDDRPALSGLLARFTQGQVDNDLQAQLAHEQSLTIQERPEPVPFQAE